MHTILLVEDEPLIALAEKSTLEANGYAVATAQNGNAA
ncbi:MAG: DNA-binding response regulator, partial [Spirochaetaceae bacterium]